MVRRSKRVSTASSATKSKSTPDKNVTKKASVTKAKIDKKAVSAVVKGKEKAVKTQIVEAKEVDLKQIATGKIVTIEACKQWGAFKSRASKILKGVGSKAVVEINKEKPGKGNFVVTVLGIEEPIVELKEMKRPFKDLKALDIGVVVSNILKAVEE